MREIIGLLVFLILSVIFSCVLCFVYVRWKKDETQQLDFKKYIIENNEKVFDSFYIKVISVFLVYIAQLILFFMFAILYNRYHSFIFAQMVAFLIIFCMSLFYLYKKGFLSRKEDGK